MIDASYHRPWAIKPCEAAAGQTRGRTVLGMEVPPFPSSSTKPLEPGGSSSLGLGQAWRGLQEGNLGTISIRCILRLGAKSLSEQPAAVVSEPEIIVEWKR